MKAKHHNLTLFLAGMAIVIVICYLCLRQYPLEPDSTDDRAASGQRRQAEKPTGHDQADADTPPATGDNHYIMFTEAAGLKNQRQKREKLSALADDLIRYNKSAILSMLRAFPDGATKEALYGVTAEKLDEVDLRTLLTSVGPDEKPWLELGVRKRSTKLSAEQSLDFAKKFVGILTPEGARNLAYAAGAKQLSGDCAAIEIAQMKAAEFTENQRSYFLEGVLAAAEPAVAAEFIDRNQQLALSQDTYTRIASYYAKSQPEKAIEWASKLSVDFSENAVSSAAVVWAQTNENKLAEHINTLGAGKIKDSCATALSLYLLGKGQTEEARDWALLVEAPSLRSKLNNSFPPQK